MIEVNGRFGSRVEGNEKERWERKGISTLPCTEVELPVSDWGRNR